MNQGFQSLTVNDPNTLKPFIEGVTGSVLAVISVSFLCAFKGSLSRDFVPLFFSWFEPICSPDNLTKIFSNSVTILQRYSNLHQPARCERHCVVGLRGGNDTVESDSAVSCKIIEVENLVTHSLYGTRSQVILLVWSKSNVAKKKIVCKQLFVKQFYIVYT